MMIKFVFPIVLLSFTGLCFGIIHVHNMEVEVSVDAEQKTSEKEMMAVTVTDCTPS